MKYIIKRGFDNTIQLVIEAQSDNEDEVLRDLAYVGSVISLGETSRGRAQLILGTPPANHRFRGINARAG